ncbi:alpha/beta hydrolase [Vibrio algicola]|nr:alpha/beta hydrolase [Vibrio algicola]
MTTLTWQGLPMLFITNRTPNQSARSKANRKISFNSQNTDISKWLFFCERNGEGDYTEILSKPFFSQLKALPAHTQILFYIHGFNNNMEPDVFGRAEQLEALLNQDDADLVKVIPIIWPCDDDSGLQIVDDYWDDQKAADYSGIAFARLFWKFDQWRHDVAQQQNPCLRRMNVLAHSMGNRVLLNAMQTWVQHTQPGGMSQLFRNVFMVAADVENQTLEQGQAGRHIIDSAKNTIVYFASDDLAMPASKIVNLYGRTLSRRMGMTGPEDLSKLPKRKVMEVDCDSFNTHFDFPTGHTYFLTDKNHVPSPIIKHIQQLIQTGRMQGEQSQWLDL